ncbi:S41 family peptidase [Tissierella carlieri]|uniref:S41 family peptidase n=2 Tax=Tissierella carlieri TaxID=689904 RepID=A0ABT1SAV2_9FIRM|nr:S41 family peptidase [Tissierella carlieri]
MKAKENKKLIFFSIYIFILLSLLGCSKKEALFTENIILSKEDLLKLRNPFQISDEDITDFIDINQTMEKLIKVTEGISYDIEYDRYRMISKKDAEEDIDIYFQTLKDCYAGYLPNGGDKRFQIAKNAIEADLKDEIMTRELEEIIKSHMSFVEDSHFKVGDDFTSNKWYKIDNIDIGKNNKGYFNLSNGKYIENIHEIDSLLKPSLLKEQTLCYQIFSQSESELPRKLIYDDGTFEELKSKTISSKHDNDGVIFKEFGKVPYLKFSQFYFPNEVSKVNKILDAVDKMSREDCSILDLRGNPGGNGTLVGQWVQRYTGETAIYSSDTILNLNSEIFKISNNGQTWEEFVEYNKIEIYDENHVIQKHSDKMINKDGLLIVLTDSSSASAAELLVDALHHVSNTVFIGMPTKGCISSSRSITIPMKNSRIAFQFGNMWNIFHKDYFQENRGFLPDIWVDDIDVEQLAKLLDSYDFD